MGLLTGSTTAGQNPEAANSPAGLMVRARACSLLQLLLSARISSNMGAAAALALHGTAMQDVLKLLLEMQAAHAPVVPCPAHAASASTSAAKGRILRLKLAGKAPTQQTADTIPAAVGVQGPSVAAGTSTQEPHAQSAAASAARGTHASLPAWPMPNQAAALAESTAAAEAAQPPVPTDNVSTAAAAEEQQVAAANAQGTAPAQQQAVPPAVLCVVLSALMKLTQQQPQHMAQQMVRSPGHLHMFLQLMGPSTQYAKCQLYAAEIVTKCLCWASSPDRYMTWPT